MKTLCKYSEKIIYKKYERRKQMSLEKESFVFYRSFFEALQDLKDKDRLKVYDAICELALNEKDTKLTGIAKTIFTLIRPQILSNTKKYKDGQKRW